MPAKGTKVVKPNAGGLTEETVLKMAFVASKDELTRVINIFSIARDARYPATPTTSDGKISAQAPNKTPSASATQSKVAAAAETVGTADAPLGLTADGKPRQRRKRSDAGKPKGSGEGESGQAQGTEGVSEVASTPVAGENALPPLPEVASAPASAPASTESVEVAEDTEVFSQAVDLG